jgi:hypothetical protein
VAGQHVDQLAAASLQVAVSESVGEPPLEPRPVGPLVVVAYVDPTSLTGGRVPLSHELEILRG